MENRNHIGKWKMNTNGERVYFSSTGIIQLLERATKGILILNCDYFKSLGNIVSCCNIISEDKLKIAILLHRAARKEKKHEEIKDNRNAILFFSPSIPFDPIEEDYTTAYEFVRELSCRKPVVIINMPMQQIKKELLGNNFVEFTHVSDENENIN